jgi:hypothetical protein
MELEKDERDESNSIEQIDDAGINIQDEAQEKAILPNTDATWIPPDGGYGWVCVATCWFINAHTWGINSVSYIVQQTDNTLTNM